MSESPEIVPEFWPPVEPFEPVKPWRVHWLLALPATVPAMLFPRRVGVHLAASSWAAAYVAHVLSVVLFFGLVGAPILELEYGGYSSGAQSAVGSYTTLEHIRRPFAAVVLLLFAITSRPFELVVLGVTIAVVEAGMWVAGVTLIPLYAAGERRARLYLRCVKLLLWSTMCLIPLGAVLLPLARWLDRNGGEGWIVVFLLAWALWYLSVQVRLGGRYAGPKQGPRWERRTPRCETCGYALTGLAEDGRCPECGRAIQDSLPARRGLPAFAAARGVTGRVGGFFQTTFAALAARRFAGRLSIWHGHRAARIYAALVCALIGLLVGLGTTPLWVSSDELDFDVVPRLGFSLTAGITAFLCGYAWLMLAGMLFTAFGFRHAATRVVVLCYSTAWLLVVALLGLAGAWTIDVIHHVFHPRGVFRWPLLEWIDKETFIGAWVMMPAVVAAVLSLLHVRRMLRETRYANG